MTPQRQETMDARQAIRQALQAQKDAEEPRLFLAVDEDDDDIGELEVAEYIIHLLALDTYVRYVEEFTGEEDPVDDVIAKGMRIMKMAEADLDGIKGFLDESLPGQTHKTMLARAMRRRVTSVAQLGQRALNLRTLLELGGAKTKRAIFKKNKLLKQIRDGVSASMMEDADAALDIFAAIPIRNARIRAWIKLAAKTAGSGEEPQNVVLTSAQQASDKASEMLASNVHEEGAVGADEVAEAKVRQQEKIEEIQRSATETAQRQMELSGEPDVPLTKSETIGVAVAAATAAVSDPSNPANVPEPLKRLDDEQRAAALTDGRVLIAAGAGAGKSTTLVARTNYLIRDRRADPERMLVTSFNTKAANELKEKLGKAAGGAAPKHVGTMHSLFGKMVRDYGTPREKAAMRNYKQVESYTSRAVQAIWKDCYKDEETPSAKKMKLAKTQWAGNRVTPQEAMEMAMESGDEKMVMAARWYEMYEGLKGALDVPNERGEVVNPWKPPCEDRAKSAVGELNDEKMAKWRSMGSNPRYRPKPKETIFEAYMARIRPNGAAQRVADFDDMLGICHDVLERDIGARKAIQKRFDHILIDECQDLNETQHGIARMMTEHITDGKDGKSLWMVGDDKQCVSVDTPVRVLKNLEKRAGDLKPGDSVVSFRNGKLVAQQVRHVISSRWAEGFKVTTESGKTLTMSPNHKIWARAPELDDDQVAVYLMFRKDMGFRVGVTGKCFSDNYHDSFGGRAFMEKAERMWVLNVCPDRESALLQEARYSLTYGIPTMVFEGGNRGINQDRVATLFEEFGKNGGRLLEDKHLRFDLPHWVSQSFTKHGRLRRTVQMTAHGAKGSQVALEWSGDDLDSQLEGVHFVRNGDRRRLRKWFTNYRQALEFAEMVAQRTGANLARRLSTDDGRIRLVTASGLFPGSMVAVEDADGVSLEAITSVEPVRGEFVDLDVEDASNFFGGGILSHNSIYAFRGARPDLFTALDGKEGWKTRMIRTNYRCAPEIVEAANRLISHNEGQIPMQANPAPGKTRGTASVKVAEPQDDAGAAIVTVEEIKVRSIDMDESERPQFYAENAVLCRTNKELHAYETACIIRGVPYARKGTGSFLGSKETSAMLGYTSLIMGGDDPKKLQKALANCINEPNRFYTGSKTPEKVDDAVRAFARKAGVYIKDVDPSVVIHDRDFQEALAAAFGGRPGSWRYKQALEKIRDLAATVQDLQANLQDPEYTTRDLFDGILGGFEGETNSTDENGVPIKTTTSLRESLLKSVRDFSSTGDEADDEGDDEDEIEQLGNIQFLYMLMEPDPTDPDDVAQSPQTPAGFAAKMARFERKAEDLRIDLNEWDKEQATLPPEQRRKPPAVYLGTVHSVKGAEWPNTYVQMPAGKFPFEAPPKRGADGEPLPKSDAELQKEAEELETERRLAYVALTRASEKLTVICPKQVGGRPAGVSPFVGEAGLKLGENVSAPEGAPGGPSLEDTLQSREASANFFDEPEVPDGWEDDLGVTPWSVE